MMVTGQVFWDLCKDQVIPAAHNEDAKNAYPIKYMDVKTIGIGTGGAHDPPIGSEDQQYRDALDKKGIKGAPDDPLPVRLFHAIGDESCYKPMK
jgi:hypothetical protein